MSVVTASISYTNIYREVISNIPLYKITVRNIVVFSAAYTLVV